jgi:hypothetical protein
MAFYLLMVYIWPLDKEKRVYFYFTTIKQTFGALPPCSTVQAIQALFLVLHVTMLTNGGSNDLRYSTDGGFPGPYKTPPRIGDCGSCPVLHPRIKGKGPTYNTA